MQFVLTAGLAVTFHYSYRPTRLTNCNIMVISTRTHTYTAHCTFTVHRRE